MIQASYDMNTQTLTRIALFGLVAGAISAMIVIILLNFGKNDDFFDLALTNLFGAGFAVIGLACAPFLLISKDHFVCALKDLALPIGLVMSCYAFTVFLGDLNQSFYIVAVLPAVAGGMISLTLADAELPKKLNPISSLKSFLLWLWIIFVCHMADMALGGDPLWKLGHSLAWILCFLVVYFFYLYNPKQTTIFQRISYGAIAAIILTVSLSTVGVGVASQQIDMDLYGNSMVLGIVGTIYGCLIYITSLLIGRLRFHYDVDSNRSNWHLAEIFTFFIILNVGPKTVFEVWEDSKNVQAIEQAVETNWARQQLGSDNVEQ